MYGIWDGVQKRFVFGIREELKSEAWRKFKKVAPRMSYLWRYGTKEIPKGFVNPKNPVNY